MISGSINTYPGKPRVYIEPYWGCQKCNPYPFTERKWKVYFPNSGYGGWTTMGCATYQLATEFDTWEEAMVAANAWRPPTITSWNSGNSTVTFTLAPQQPWN